MNKVVLSGRICTDLELKKTSTDVSVCSFRLAVQRRFKNAEGNYDADFISCVAWRNNAEFICKYFSKGDPIELGGSLQTGTYENDGHKIYATDVVIDDAGFVLSKKESTLQNNTSTQEEPRGYEAEGFFPTPADDDLPF
jgi:single-strand DNA-binding protein